MPSYDYECTKCEHVQEELHRMSESPKIKCEKCGSKSKKKITTGYQFNMGENAGTDPNEVQ